MVHSASPTKVEDMRHEIEEEMHKKQLATSQAQGIEEKMLRMECA